MGDLQVCSPPRDGMLTEERLFPSSLSSSVSSSSSSSDPPHPLLIGADCWLKAEQTTQEIIWRVQPTVVSEQRRRKVIDYLQRLIRGYLGIEAFPFGSVPLKTYLPDGDIDLTALSSQNVEDSLPSDVHAVLESEEENKDAEFEVKDVQYIHAEVKLVKCLVQNIVVDISFNQVGGLCSLCFLEQVDLLIGKDHLFKRSVILIKAWCYYESRILGAHHGLISTYALETLVLYIFHLFHSSLNGPLAVLYRFLDYFSKFDWDNYCISLNGPVCISSLPDIVAETPENGGDDLLFSKEFLRNCVNMFWVPSKGPETNSRAFPQKHFNIVDPLKENNNLGRSVSKANDDPNWPVGNFHRIRSAFSYGARKLGRILLLPGENIADELNKFFINTLDRHVSGQRPDVQDPVLPFGANGSSSASSFSDIDTCAEDKLVPESPSGDYNGITEKSMFDSQGSSCEGINNIRISGTENNFGSRISSEPPKYFAKVVPSPIVLEADCPANGNAVSRYHLAEDTRDLATSKNHGLRITNEKPKSSPLRSEAGTSLLWKAHDGPRLAGLFKENGKIGNGNPDQTNPAYSIFENKGSSRLERAPDQEKGFVLRRDLKENQLVKNGTINSCSNRECLNPVGSKYGTLISSPVTCPSEDLYLNYRDWDLDGTAGSPEALIFLADLSGDYESHSRSLQYGQLCHDYALSMPVLPNPPSSSQFRNKNAWDTLRQSVQLQWNVFSHMNVNGVKPFYPVNPPKVSGTAFGVEEKSKPRGTGTYFPVTLVFLVELSRWQGLLSQSAPMFEILQNHHPFKEKPSRGRGRNQVSVTHGQLQRHPRNNVRAAAPPETNLLEKGILELSQAQISVLPGRGKTGLSDFHQSGRPAMRGLSHANGFLLPSDRLEIGSFVFPLGLHSLDRSRQPDSGTSDTQGSTPSLPTPSMQRQRPMFSMNQERIAVQSYRLKDEDDFPPLSI
ncbi:hypothetical protein HHK36_010587 [Tetracentron sinense]|uniref:Uncharacterized protein n=1 Tax=Tetracentron sinense TaxID=13715 RepID=A0A834ZH46_TETSI|nr:hypothetical protein HHK36_010587 [Tetracentron sinense]